MTDITICSVRKGGEVGRRKEWGGGKEGRFKADH